MNKRDLASLESHLRESDLNTITLNYRWVCHGMDEGRTVAYIEVNEKFRTKHVKLRTNPSDARSVLDTVAQQLMDYLGNRHDDVAINIYGSYLKGETGHEMNFGLLRLLTANPQTNT